MSLVISVSLNIVLILLIVALEVRKRLRGGNQPHLSEIEAALLKNRRFELQVPSRLDVSGLWDRIETRLEAQYQKRLLGDDQFLNAMIDVVFIGRRWRHEINQVRIGEELHSEEVVSLAVQYMWGMFLRVINPEWTDYDGPPVEDLRQIFNEAILEWAKDIHPEPEIGIYSSRDSTSDAEVQLKAFRSDQENVFLSLVQLP